MGNMHSKACLLLLLPMLLSSCGSGSKGREAIKREQFVAVYASLLEEDIRARTYVLDSVAAAGNNATVLADAGVTREDFQNTMKWYNADVERWQPFLDDVVRKLEARSLKQMDRRDPSPPATMQELHRPAI